MRNRDTDDFSAVWLKQRHSLVLPVVTWATDDTNLAYLAVIRAALDAIETGFRHHHWPAPVSFVELDALSAICNQMIYVQRRGPEFGQKLHEA